ncbi:MAG: RIP metalloprotease RseP [Pseudobdellovibrionaceae bacterium]
MELLLYYTSVAFYYVIPFVVLLGVLIFVHELGHFLVARWCGVKVEVFSLGFGKKIFQYKRGDTNYCISMIPFGGYVKMFGEQPGEEISASDRKVSFTHKSVWQRIAIVSAGPLMNFFFAIFVFMIISTLGEEAPVARIGDVEANSKAYAVGFRSGDLIRMVGDDPVITWDDVQKKLNKFQNQTVQFTLQRGVSAESILISTEVAKKENPNPISLDSMIGDVEGFTTLSKGTRIGVRADSKLKALGLKTGDEITSVNGEKVKFYRDLVERIGLISSNVALTFDVKRPSEDRKKFETMTVTFAGFGEGTGFYNLDMLGVESSDLYLYEVKQKSPADLAGLQAGDRLQKISNEEIFQWEQVVSLIKKYDGKNPLPVEIRRDGEVLQKEIVPEMTSQMSVHGAEDRRYTIGIVPNISLETYDYVKVRIKNPFESFVRAVGRTWNMSVLTLVSFAKLIKNEISPKNIGGVISIAQVASETFKIGVVPFLTMMAFISVNLFVLNLLPVPVLDGGHLVFYIIEAIKGSPVSLRKMEIAQQVGIVLLMSLMAFALFNDFSRIFGFM